MDFSQLPGACLTHVAANASDNGMAHRSDLQVVYDNAIRYIASDSYLINPLYWNRSTMDAQLDI